MADEQVSVAPGRGLDALGKSPVQRRTRSVPPPPPRPVPKAEPAPDPAPSAPVGAAPAGAPEPALSTRPVMRAAPEPAPVSAGAPVAGRQALHRLTVDVRLDLEERLSDTLHTLRRYLSRPATRVEVVEVMLADLPAEHGEQMRLLAERIEERRRSEPRR